MNQETPKPDKSNDTPPANSPAKPEIDKIKPDAGDKKLYGDRGQPNNQGDRR